MNRRAYGQRAPDRGELVAIAALLVVGLTLLGALSGQAWVRPNPAAPDSAVSRSSGTPSPHSADIGATSPRAAEPSHPLTRPSTGPGAPSARASAGKSPVSSLRIVADQNLSTNILVAPNPTDAGLATSFSLESTGGTPPFSYSWIFGDGSQGTSATEDHTYLAAGTYAVEAWENDSLGNSSLANTSVLVNPALQILSLTATPNPMHVNQPVNFNAVVTGGSLPYTFAWTFGDGSTGGDVSATSHTYSTGGPFQANLSVTDPAGSLLTASVEIAVVMVANVSADASLGAPPLTTSFTSDVAGGAPGYTYSWSFGDGGTSTLADPIYTYEAPGNYTASLLVTDSLGNTATANWSITIFPGGTNLTAQLQASVTSLSVDHTTNITLTVSGGAGKYTITWPSVPIGCVQTSLFALSCKPTQGGTYNATAQVTDSVGDLAVATVSYTVQGLLFPVSFDESGLPAGVEWYVNASGALSLSNLTSPTGGDSVATLLTNGTYPLLVSSSDKRWAASYPTDLTVNGAPTSVSIVFALVTYSVSVQESGLPAGLTWSVTFNSVVGVLTTNGATDALTFPGEPNGSYAYSIAPVRQWVQDTLPAAGTETVNGSALVFLLTYAPPTYPVTFEETGLPSGEAWSVTLNGSTLSATTDAIVFLVENGSLAYSVAAVGNWTPSLAEGDVTVTGTPASVTVGFLFTYLLSFGRPNGTPNGTVWSVSVSGPNVLSSAAYPEASVSLSGTGPSIRFNEPNGTYVYSITVPDYPNYSSVGNQTISGATEIVIPPPLPSSSPGGGGSGGSPNVTSVPAYLIYEGVVAVTLILLTAALVSRRRRAPPASPALAAKTRPPTQE
jgi:PKD repeat protein